METVNTILAAIIVGSTFSALLIPMAWAAGEAVRQFLNEFFDKDEA